MKNIRIGSMEGSTMKFICPNKREYDGIDEDSLALYVVARTSEYFRNLKSDIKTGTHSMMDLTLRLIDPVAGIA